MQEGISESVGQFVVVMGLKNIDFFFQLVIVINTRDVLGWGRYRGVSWQVFDLPGANIPASLFF